jgi:hypothetical protein
MSAATEEVIEMCSVRVGGTLFGVSHHAYP